MAADVRESEMTDEPHLLLTFRGLPFCALRIMRRVSDQKNVPSNRGRYKSPFPVNPLSFARG
jgi:hypothetical protein